MEAATEMVETEELKPKPRNSLKGLLGQFNHWRTMMNTMKHTELAEIILDESGYTEMWAEGQISRCAGSARKPEGAYPFHGRIRLPAELSGTYRLGHGSGFSRNE